VVLDAMSLGPETMQKIASELNAPTIGFLVGYEAGIEPTYLVRYFTPRQEVDRGPKRKKGNPGPSFLDSRVVRQYPRLAANDLEDEVRIVGVGVHVD
jgi:hypothetical protein